MSDERFLSRWMRRKVAARQNAEAPPVLPPEQTPAPPIAQPLSSSAPDTQSSELEQAVAPLGEPRPAEQEPPRELPSIDSLQGVASDYQAFMRADVDTKTRGAALRKLFADPHFHFDQMDKLDIYIDDYGKPDPIPPAMLAALQQAQSLLTDRTDTAPEASSESEANATAERESLSVSDEAPSAMVDAPERKLENEELESAEGGADDPAGIEENRASIARIDDGAGSDNG